MEKFLEVLNSYSVIIVIASIMFIAFARSIVKIFKMGATFKVELATKKELNDFEAEVRKDMRGYASQIQDAVTKSSLAVINEKLRNIDEIEKIATEIKVLKAEIDTKLENIDEKYEELKSLRDNLRSLSAAVSRLEYNQENKSTRRTE